MPTPETLRDKAATQLDALLEAVAMPQPDRMNARTVLDVVSTTWGARAIACTPRWSGVSDDCSPIEYSIALQRGGAQLRLLCEAQADAGSPTAYFEAGRDLSRRVATMFGARHESLATLERLFEPNAAHVGEIYFAMLHGVVLRPGHAPLVKVYFNPHAHGRAAAPDVLRDALEVLGQREAWALLRPHLREEDVPQFLAVDLLPRAQARTKVYVRHEGPRCGDGVERLFALAPRSDRALARWLIEALLETTAWSGRPPLTMLTCRDGEAGWSSAALHVATFPRLGTDADVARRLLPLLQRLGISARPYARCLAALSERPLAEECGLHNYVCIQGNRDEPRITTYLGARMYLFRRGAIGLHPRRAWPTPQPSIMPGLRRRPEVMGP